jgi:hypothetical protein
MEAYVLDHHAEVVGLERHTQEGELVDAQAKRSFASLRMGCRVTTGFPRVRRPPS